MIIGITETWRITSDRYCWRVQRYTGIYKSGAKLNSTKWKTRGYYSALGEAVKGCATMLLREANTTTNREAVAVATRIADTINAALERVGIAKEPST